MIDEEVETLEEEEAHPQLARLPAVLVLGLELGIVRSNARLAAEGILTILERLPNSIAHRRRVQVLQRRVQW